MKTLQYFSDAYLEQCKNVTPEQTLTFLEQFRQLQQPTRPAKSKLISMKIPEPLLDRFRQRCEAEGVKYQTQIKTLMELWLAHPVSNQSKQQPSNR